VRFAALLLAGALWVAPLAGQSPVHIAYECPAEDRDTFGLTCSPEEPCAVFLELSAVEAAGARLFLAGNLHTSEVTLYGILLASEDSGKTWAEPIPRVKASPLEQIQFYDLQNGWISGQALDPLPRNPFLLRTDDGGKTWRRLPLSEDTKYGSISQFWFDTRTHGELLLDNSRGSNVRQELYESMTGGGDWAVRESGNRSLHLSQTHPKNDGPWRIQADAAAKTYRIERGFGTKWETVATFAIHVGDCR